MDLLEQARAAAGPDFTDFTRVDVITPEMPYDLARFLAVSSSGEILEISLSSDPSVAPRRRPLDAEEASHARRAGLLEADRDSLGLPDA